MMLSLQNDLKHFSEICKAGSRAVGSYSVSRIFSSYAFASFFHRASCHSLEISWRKANVNNRS